MGMQHLNRAYMQATQTRASASHGQLLLDFTSGRPYLDMKGPAGGIWGRSGTCSHSCCPTDPGGHFLMTEGVTLHCHPHRQAPPFRTTPCFNDGKSICFVCVQGWHQRVPRIIPASAMGRPNACSRRGLGGQERPLRALPRAPNTWAPAWPQPPTPHP